MLEAEKTNRRREHSLGIGRAIPLGQSLTEEWESTDESRDGGRRP